MVMYKRKPEWVDAVQFVPGMEDGFHWGTKPYVFDVYNNAYDALNFNYGCWLIKGVVTQTDGTDRSGWVDWYTDEEFNSLYEE